MGKRVDSHGPSYIKTGFKSATWPTAKTAFLRGFCTLEIGASEELVALEPTRNLSRRRAVTVVKSLSEERSVAAAPNPVTADEVAAMKKELEVAGAELVVPRANEEEGFQLAVEKA